MVNLTLFEIKQGYDICNKPFLYIYVKKYLFLLANGYHYIFLLFFFRISTFFTTLRTLLGTYKMIALKLAKRLKYMLRLFRELYFLLN